MKKRQKILNFILIFAMICSTLVFAGVESIAADAPVSVPAAPKAPVVPAPSVAPATPLAPVVQQPAVQVPKQDVKAPLMPQKNAYAADKAEHTGIKYAFFKFLMAMLGVLVSSLAIYGGLKLYKKLVLKNDAKLNNIDYDKTLESPKDFKEAINLFLHKTNKR